MPRRAAAGGGPRQSTMESPPEEHEAVVKHDVNGFAFGVARGVYVGTGGDIALVLKGVALTYKNIPSGSYIPGFWERVNATGTTAADMIAWR